MEQKIYNAPPTVSKFMKDDSFMRLIIGPFGSGKSTGCIMEIVRKCKEMPPGPDGFRRSRWAVVRNTRPQLKDTTLKSWFDWIPPGLAGRWKESDMTFILEVGDVKAEILFRPLDTPDDIARTLSLELTGVWVNECREIPREIIEALHGRLRRFPRRADVPDYWSGMICDTNPPEVDSFWYKVAEGIPYEDDNPDAVMECAVFRQPSGLSPEAENRENLHPEYYIRLARGKSKEWVDVYVHGLYGPSVSGKPVYHRVFKQERHISKIPLLVDANLPVIIGMDFGLTPAAIFKQQTPFGRVFTLRECVEFDMGIKRFTSQRLIPTIKAVFPGNPVLIIGDPAGARRSESDEGTCFKELKNAGFKVKPARTNDAVVRIQATETMLSAFPDGEPMEVIDLRCKYYIEGLRSKYRYPKHRLSGEFSDRPEKNNWSHIVEAGQYADLFLQSGKYHLDDFVRFEDNVVRVNRSYRPADTYTGY